ncbi:general transcription factor II-I repeat domain-containing protein 2A-like, partial [Linepithema humile]|uniref:general transcription factor II-I repeat domain-containing protein 2A-like n=1 Tax=Linepithema humile TaxID=83485 RepID=UPI00351F138F
LLESCSFFSLCLDESTDNRHVSQLSIFARIVQNDFSHVEALLDFVPLHNRTTGIDIFTAVNQTLQKFGIDFSKCSAIVTDGAKAMIGSKNGFFGQLKQRNLKFPVIHCIIHQEALCGKDVKLCTAMQTVTKITNVIKGGNKFLSHRKFQHFLEEHNAVYTDVPLHCEVRWLSAGKCLEKFFAIRKEIFLFLQEQLPIKYNEFKFFFEDLDSLCELAVITDVTNHLNILNVKLQKTDQIISQLLSHIDSFRRKLQLFKNHLENNIFHFFPSCQIIFEEHGTKCNFKTPIYLIDSLISQFNKRFSDFKMLRKDLILFENPLTVQIEEQSLEFQEELCDLQSDVTLKARLEKGIEFF